MACVVPKKFMNKSEYVQNEVLDYFQALVGPAGVVTPDTSLGKNGLGHTMVRRKLYRDGIAARLAVNGCSLKSLRPSDFADAKLRSIGDVANMVEKDVV